MSPPSVGRSPRGLLFVLLFALVAVASADPEIAPRVTGLTPTTCEAAAGVPIRAFPSIDRGCGPTVEYLGVYSSDGKFTRASSFAIHNADLHDSWSRPSPTEMRPPEVPPSITLHPRDRSVEDFELPVYGRKPAKGHAIFSSVLDQIVTLAYGRERIFQTPQHIITDSKGRAIITDPAASAVHVLDSNGAFRIAGGEHRHLQTPNGIAVDARDNIYVADSTRGLVLVYDRDGRFLRYIGKRGNEGIFYFPAGLAIDRNRGRIYLLDTPRNLLFVLDLEGKILGRIGSYRGNPSSIEFREPSEIVLANSELAILDSAGARIQILDLQGNRLRQFSTRVGQSEERMPEMGLGVDSKGNIYISNLAGASVRVYDREGHRLSSFGGTGLNLGEFLSPTGVWVDFQDRIYVTDTDSRRVQVFQLGGVPPRRQAGE